MSYVLPWWVNFFYTLWLHEALRLPYTVLAISTSTYSQKMVSRLSFRGSDVSYWQDNQKPGGYMLLERLSGFPSTYHMLLNAESATSSLTHAKPIWKSSYIAVLFTPHDLKAPDHDSDCCVVWTEHHELAAWLGGLLYKTKSRHEKVTRELMQEMTWPSHESGV